MGRGGVAAPRLQPPALNQPHPQAGLAARSRPRLRAAREEHLGRFRRGPLTMLSPKQVGELHFPEVGNTIRQVNGHAGTDNRVKRVVEGVNPPLEGAGVQFVVEAHREAGTRHHFRHLHIDKVVLRVTLQIWRAGVRMVGVHGNGSGDTSRDGAGRVAAQRGELLGAVLADLAAPPLNHRLRTGYIFRSLRCPATATHTTALPPAPAPAGVGFDDCQHLLQLVDTERGREGHDLAQQRRSGGARALRRAARSSAWSGAGRRRAAPPHRAARAVVARVSRAKGDTIKTQRTGGNNSGRGPDAGRTIEFKETDTDRTRTGRRQRRFSQASGEYLFVPHRHSPGIPEFLHPLSPHHAAVCGAGGSTLQIQGGGHPRNDGV
eukprot:gene6759-biopygen10468